MDGDLAEIPKWAQRYARNRTLGVAWMLAVFLVVPCAMTGLALGCGWLFRQGQRPLGVAGAVLLIGLTLWWVWFLAVGIRGFAAYVGRRLHADEGTAVAAGGAPCVAGRATRWIAPVFLACVGATAILVGLGSIPLRFTQPVTALYGVPFMVYLVLVQRQAVSPFLLLWPLLYAVHAALIVAGLPLNLPERYAGLDVVIPLAGYGVLAALVGHVYGRYALRRLRRLTRDPEGAAR
jgi:hypothetical protein